MKNRVTESDLGTTLTFCEISMFPFLSVATLGTMAVLPRFFKVPANSTGLVWAVSPILIGCPKTGTMSFPNVTTGAYGGGIRIYKPLSFVRLQDLSVSYSLPVAVAQRFRLDSFRAFISARNLYSFDNWPGWDPESRMAPMPRTFSLGFSLSL